MVDRVRALELAGSLVVAYPGRHVTEEHAQAWADELETLSEAHASRVVALLAERCADPPSRAQLLQTVREVLQVTMSPPVAPRRGDWLPEAEIARRVRELVARWAAPETEPEVDRDAEWERVRQATLAGARLAGVCNGAGREARITEDGRRVCPDCGIELEPAS